MVQSLRQGELGIFGEPNVSMAGEEFRECECEWEAGGVPGRCGLGVGEGWGANESRDPWEALQRWWLVAVERGSGAQTWYVFRD